MKSLVFILILSLISVNAISPLAPYDVNGDGILQCKEIAAEEVMEACLNDKTRISRLSDLDIEVKHQLHIQLMDDPHSMQIRWVTVDLEKKENARVAYRMENSSHVMEAEGKITTYDVGYGIGWHGWIYTVPLTNLELDTTYEYQIDSEIGDKEWHKFHTSPASPHSPKVVRIGCSGDIGTVIPAGMEVSKEMYRYHKEEKPLDASVAIGDLSYAGTSVPAPAPGLLGNGGETEAVWDVFGTQIEDLNSEIPIIPVVGNHEKFYNYTSYRYRYTDEFWYTRKVGPVFMMIFSTQHPYTPGSPQYEWMDQTLAQARSENWPWIILFTHRPMYASDKSENNQHRAGAPLQQAIEPLLVKHKVDLMLSGHMHIYERVYPVINGIPSMKNTNVYHKPNATAHVVQGTGGCYPGFDEFEPSVPAWSAKRTLHEYGFGVFEATQTSLNYQFISLHGKLDEFTIEK